MKRTINQNESILRLLGFLLAVSFLLMHPGEAQAQWVTKWLNVGSLHHAYGEAGGIPEAMYTQVHALQWPAHLRDNYNQRSAAMWVTATNWEDENGEVYPVKIAHIGPRELGIGQMHPQRFDLIARFERPRVYVDGLETFEKAVTLDAVDESIPSDRMLHSVINTVTGITVEKKIYAFSQEYHDDYHIHEVTLTNTGNTDDDEDIELPDQTMEGVYFYETVRHAGPSGSGFGNYDMNDVVTGEATDEIDDYEYDIDFRGYFVWPGHLRNTELGQPLIQRHGSESEADTVGRLRATQFTGKIALHADHSPGDRSNDASQPVTLGYMLDKDGKPHDQYDIQEMQLNFERYVTAGEMIPHHADIVQPPDPKYSSWIERFADQTSDPGIGVNGYSETWAFGPYTLAPGESVRIVYVQAAAGISTDAAIQIGKAYKAAGVWNNGTGGNKGPKIEYDANGDGTVSEKERRTKNEWFMTGRDSLFQTFRRARANFESGYEIPQPPLPPQEFRVTSGTDRIVLEWETYSGEPDPPGGWEIYRARNNWYGDIQDEFKFDLIASLGPGERSYEDTEVNRGINYYYYIQAVGPINDDPTGMTPTNVPLKSSRFYTQTYDPAVLKRAPGSTLEAVRIVPNPYHIGSDQNVRWPDEQDKIGFLEIPGKCTIRIYSELGELIRTIEHTDGSGDEYWDMTTSSTQLVVSGVYVAVITDEETGSQVVKPFIIIR